MDEIHKMLALQADIKTELMKSLPEHIAHIKAAEIMHMVMESPLIKPEYEEMYEDLR